MNGIFRIVTSRVIGAILLLTVLSLLIFSLLYLAPGDLVQVLLGFQIEKTSAETIAQIRAQYHLDDPFIVQYLSWLSNLFQGDLGTSIRYQDSVTNVVLGRVWATALLAGFAFTIACTLAVPLGVLSAVRAGKHTDRAVVLSSVFVASAPPFAFALLMIYVFGVTLGLFPIYGTGTGGIDTLWHFALPAITLGLTISAGILKLTRTSVLRELSSDYITAARAHGIDERRIRRIALRNAAIPIVTSAGLVLAYLVSGAVIIETVFALPGLGMLLQDAVLYKDVPVVQFLTLLIAVFIIAVALLVDLSYVLLDPRLRRRSGRTHD